MDPDGESETARGDPNEFCEEIEVDEISGNPKLTSSPNERRQPPIENESREVPKTDRLNFPQCKTILSQQNCRGPIPQVQRSELLGLICVTLLGWTGVFCGPSGAATVIMAAPASQYNIAL